MGSRGLWVVAVSRMTLVSVGVAAFVAALLSEELTARAASGEDDDATTEEAPSPGPLVPVPSHASKVAGPREEEMVSVPGGTLTMGTSDPKAPPNERTLRVVTVAPFRMDRTEVTVGAYRRCVVRGQCERPPQTSALCTYDGGDEELPVNCIPWTAAARFCRGRGKRLPTEAEWEFAARGPNAFPYPWGFGASSCALAATLTKDVTATTCTGARPARVGNHGAGVHGLFDMAGNVEEWTADWYAEFPKGGVPPHSGASHVLKGGGWLSPPTAVRATARNWGSVLEAGPNVGFRCARTLRGAGAD